MKQTNLFFFSVILIISSCSSPEKEPDTSMPPAWAKEAIWYQIFVERFNNGDPSNDPTPQTIYAASNFMAPPNDWSVTPWTQNWYKQDDWVDSLDLDFYGGLQLRRYGGDLQGVLNKLDHLEELGINAIYFNPLNDAPSLHKFDARNYRHIDVSFGPDPIGDQEIMASEIPDDPSTWQWTAADKLFLKLVDECHQRKIRVIVDYSWNHTGVEFWAWRDILENQEKSKYKDWYEIKQFDDSETPENEFDYHGWMNLHSLPEIKKVDKESERVVGFPYEGDIHPEFKKHIYAVTERWLAPDGDVSKGIDGYRLDVADHIGMKFWRDWRIHVKNINPEAYLVGEIWWVSWPDKLMNPVPYVSGDVFDAVMFYQVYRPARYFFAKTEFEITAQQLVDSLNFQWNRLQEPILYAMMNTAATHDSPRLLTSFDHKGKYKALPKANVDPTINTGKPYPESYQRTKLYLIHQFTSIGAPQIWNGDELGMWGGDDPDCRKPLWWPEYDFEPEYRNSILPGEKTFDEVAFDSNHLAFYKKMIRMRKENPVLSFGELEFLRAEGKLLSYRRFDEKSEIIVMFNLSALEQEFELPAGKTYKDILFNGQDEVEGNITIPPLSAFVCKTIP